MATLITMRSILHRRSASPVGAMTLEKVWSLVWTSAVLPSPMSSPAQPKLVGTCTVIFWTVMLSGLVGMLVASSSEHSAAKCIVQIPALQWLTRTILMLKSLLFVSFKRLLWKAGAFTQTYLWPTWMSLVRHVALKGKRYLGAFRETRGQRL